MPRTLQFQSLECDNLLLVFDSSNNKRNTFLGYELFDGQETANRKPDYNTMNFNAKSNLFSDNWKFKQLETNRQTIKKLSVSLALLSFFILNRGRREYIPARIQ